jgi:hypothetical protein
MRATFLRRSGFLRALATVVLAALIVTIVSPRPASAKREYLERVLLYFRLNEQTTGKCVLCHNVKEKEKPGEKNLGLFGREIHAAFESNKDLRINPELAVAKVFEKDSDGDTVLNREELALGSFPGDPKSVPDRAKLLEYRKNYAEAMKRRQSGR